MRNFYKPYLSAGDSSNFLLTLPTQFSPHGQKQGKLNTQQLLDKVTLDELRYIVPKHAKEVK